jgi:tellurite resistance protein TehA-like permease
VTAATRRARAHRWPGVAAWALWALAMLGVAAVAWLDQLTRRAGRPELAQLTLGAYLGPVLALVSAATVGAVLASRRPRHPVGWLLLLLGLSLAAGGVVPAYVAYGLLTVLLGLGYAAATISAFSARVHQQVDLDTLTGELLAVVDQTMQPTQVSLWLRPSHPA